MRDDPTEGEKITLIVTAVDEEPETRDRLETAIEQTEATVADRLEFGSLRVETTQEQIDPLCELDGIESIETDNVVGYGGDAGEDV